MQTAHDNWLDNLIALPHSDKIKWVAVGHTHMHIHNKTEAQIQGMLLEAKKTGKFFTRKLTQFFNGHKGITNSSHPNNPLIISHLHTGPLNRPSSTIHYHFAFGNIPSAITQQDMLTVFSELWIGKAQQSRKSVWLERARDDNTDWLHYGHRENKFRAQLGLDIEATYIPSTI